MPGIVPQVAQELILNGMLGKTPVVTFPLTVKLYSNDVTPAQDDIAADYTEVTGGGYVDVDIPDGGDFDVVAGNPSQGEYNLGFIEYNFTGTTGGSGKVYGYYIVDANGVLVNAQRGDAADGITIENGSLVKVLPIFRLGNAVL